MTPCSGTVVPSSVCRIAAGALVVYFHGATPTDPAQPSHHLFEMTSDCGVTMVLKTEQGPVVLMGDDDDEGP